MKKCLIIDDSELSRALCASVLASLNIEFDESANGDEALKICLSNMPDLIIIDWMMPDMSGLTLLEKIRKLKDGNKPFILFCSAKNRPEDIQKAIQTGANSYFKKPVKPELLAEKIKTLINGLE